ncbi:MAG: LamG domain-containing protein [Planctomycetota bacterium]
MGEDDLRHPDWYPIISCNTAGGDNVGWLAVDDGYADFGSLTGTMYVTDNNWHHLAYTRIADSGSLYVDGVLEGTHTPGFNFSTSNLWSIGQEWDGGPATSDFFIGTVDDARIYNYGLSYAEIAALAGRAQPFDKPF